MTVRSGMADYRQAGFGGLAFITHIGLATMHLTYEQRWWSLDAEYHFTLAKIELDPKYNQDEKVITLVSEIRDLLDRANIDYRSEFESHSTTSDLENAFKLLLSQIMGKVTQLQAIVKMIETVTIEQTVVG